nr:GDP-L-fucose synthase [Desulfobulbaceae bacterium]
MNKNSKIYIAGHRGLVGSAILRKLQTDGYTNLTYRTSKELNLINQQDVADFFARESPDYVFFAAARVGGINANNTYRADFIYQNLMIQANVIHQSWVHNVKRLLFLGSSCIYPRECPQPIREEFLMTGALEPTNSPYATAKIAGIEMCWSYNSQYGTQFIPVMPTNLYGTNDNFDLESSHVLPAMIRKFHLAKMAMQGDLEAIQKDELTYGSIPPDIKNAIGYKSKEHSLSTNTSAKVILWGSGAPKREFLHAEDMVDACTFIMNQPDRALNFDLEPFASCLYNIGSGSDQTIYELAMMIKEIVGYDGEIAWDNSKPDGTPQKLLDSNRINLLGWNPSYTLRDGLQKTYDWYCSNLMG